MKKKHYIKQKWRFLIDCIKWLSDLKFHKQYSCLMWLIALIMRLKLRLFNLSSRYIWIFFEILSGISSLNDMICLATNKYFYCSFHFPVGIYAFIRTKQPCGPIRKRAKPLLGIMINFRDSSFEPVCLKKRAFPLPSYSKAHYFIEWFILTHTDTLHPRSSNGRFDLQLESQRTIFAKQFVEWLVGVDPHILAPSSDGIVKVKCRSPRLHQPLNRSPSFGLVTVHVLHLNVRVVWKYC